MMQLLTDDVLVRGDTQLLTTVAIGVLAMNLFQSDRAIVQSHLIGHFSQRLKLGLILDYGYRLLRLPRSYFEARRSGEVVSRIADVNAINALVIQIVLGLPSQFLIAIASLCVMLFYSWQLTLASAIAFLLVAAVNLLFLPALQQKTRTQIVLGTENQGNKSRNISGHTNPQNHPSYSPSMARISDQLRSPGQPRLEYHEVITLQRHPHQYTIPFYQYMHPLVRQLFSN